MKRTIFFVMLILCMGIVTAETIYEMSCQLKSASGGNCGTGSPAYAVTNEYQSGHISPGSYSNSVYYLCCDSNDAADSFNNMVVTDPQGRSAPMLYVMFAENSHAYKSQTSPFNTPVHINSARYAMACENLPKGTSCAGSMECISTISETGLTEGHVGLASLTATTNQCNGGRSFERWVCCGYQAGFTGTTEPGVTVRDGAGKFSTVSDGSGWFYLPVDAGQSYDILFIKPGFEPVTIPGRYVNYGQIMLLGDGSVIELEDEYNECTPDCALRSNPGLCDPTCAQHRPGLCGNFNPNCEQKQPGHVYPTGDGQEYVCCTGTAQDKVEQKVSTVQVGEGKDVVRTTRIIKWQGKQIRMIIDTVG